MIGSTVVRSFGRSVVRRPPSGNHRLEPLVRTSTSQATTVSYRTTVRPNDRTTRKLRRRGFTLVELALVAVLTGLIVGAVGGMFIFAASRSAHALANEAVLQQTTTVLNQLEKTVSQATTCSSVSLAGGAALKCTMPQNGTDFDGDGYMDSFTPYQASRRATEQWGTGQRVWFFNSDSTGNPSNVGTYVWRAKRSDDSNPTTSDADATWTKYYGGSVRNPAITGFSFTVNSAAHTVSITLTANQLDRAQRSGASSSDSATSQSITVTRTIYWRNWRQ